jgi:hypothetical protein
MGLSAQGCKLRRQGTAAGSTAACTGLDLFFDGSTLLRRTTEHGASGFVAAGFTTGMRIWTHTTDATNANNALGFTIHTVAATVIGLYEDAVPTATIVGGVYGVKMTEVGGITNFSAPSGSPSIIDITNLGSTAKEKIVGFVDEGQFTFEVNVDSSDHIQWTHLKADRLTRTKRTWDILFSDMSTVAGATAVPSAALFDGYLTGYSVNAAVDAALKGNITIEIDGPVRWSTKAVAS